MLFCEIMWNLKINCYGEEEKTYAKAEIKIIEVKTEGVIAASGGIIIKPGEDDYTIFCNPNNYAKNCINEYTCLYLSNKNVAFSQ